MIVNFEGNVRTGKTASAKYLLNWSMKKNPKYNIYSNIHIKDFDYIDISTINDLSDIETVPNIFFLDEIWKYCDCRKSQSFVNILFSDEVLQSGHKQIDIISTTQLHGAMDKRYRYILNWRVIPQILTYDPINRFNGKKIPVKIKWIIYKVQLKKIAYKTIKDIRPFLNTYDTYELVKRIENDSYNDIIVKYCEWDKKRTALESLLMFKEKLKQADAKRISKFISQFTPKEVCENIGEKYKPTNKTVTPG